MPSKKKRDSGGKRAAAAKRKTRDAARARTQAKKLVAAAAPVGFDMDAELAKLGPPPVGKPNAGHSWLADAMLIVIKSALHDVGLPLEQRREQAGRLVAQAAKVMEPAKLSAKLAEYERALEELSRATPVGQREDGESRPPSPLQ